ncbi:MAG: DUF4363 family protein [Ruminococcus sp.]|nr:DUF4363 family protein [Ruminococcus sp.]
MIRLKISIGILAILIIFCTVSEIFINKSCDSMVEKISELESMADSENLSEELEKSVDKLEKKWDSFKSKAIFLARGDKLTDASFTLSRILPLIEEKSDELKAELSQLKSEINHIKESENLFFSNVF